LPRPRNQFSREGSGGRTLRRRPLKLRTNEQSTPLSLAGPSKSPFSAFTETRAGALKRFYYPRSKMKQSHRFLLISLILQRRTDQLEGREISKSSLARLLRCVPRCVYHRVLPLAIVFKTGAMFTHESAKLCMLDRVTWNTNTPCVCSACTQNTKETARIG